MRARSPVPCLRQAAETSGERRANVSIYTRTYPRGPARWCSFLICINHLHRQGAIHVSNSRISAYHRPTPAIAGIQVEFIENRTFDEIKIGDTATLERTLTEQDITLFAVMSGDINPAHVDSEFDDRKCVVKGKRVTQ